MVALRAVSYRVGVVLLSAVEAVAALSRGRLRTSYGKAAAVFWTSPESRRSFSAALSAACRATASLRTALT